MNRMLRFILKPEEEFSKTKKEKWGVPMLFFTFSILVISLITPLFNLMGVESNDLSSSLISQIMAYDALSGIKSIYGPISYMFSPSWILGFAFLVMAIETVIIHLIYKFALKSKGTMIDAFKCVCYSIAPCVIGGYIPFVAVFVLIYSMALKLYIFPKIAYNAKRVESLLIFVAGLSIVFMELFIFGSTLII